MKKYQTIQTLYNSGVVAVIRASHEDEAISLVKACMEGGIKGIEITFTVPNADQIIHKLTTTLQSKEVVIGAGTILDVTTARIAILQGAAFIVGPNFDSEIAKLCNLYQIPYFAGCYSINEIVEALKYGVDIIKVFPGNSVGPEYLRALKGPLPQAQFMPTGGVTLDTVKNWIQCGADLLGVGGEITAPGKKGDYLEVTKRARAFVDAVIQAKAK